MSTRTLMTMEQFLQLPDEESYRYELWQGELIDVGETTLAHNWIREKILLAIAIFLIDTKIGGEVFAETGIRFDSNTLVRPDLAYWDGPHLTGVDWNQSPVEIVPQLIAEVASPSNSRAKLFRNAEYYLRAGVQAVWVIDRDPFEIHVFEQGQPKRILSASDKLEAPSILPGFSEDVSRFIPPER